MATERRQAALTIGIPLPAMILENDEDILEIIKTGEFVTGIICTQPNLPPETSFEHQKYIIENIARINIDPKRRLN